MRPAADVLRSEEAWLLRCADLVPALSTEPPLDRLRAVARSHDGTLVSRRYTRARDPYTWRCANGHTFELSWDQAKQGRWCGRCAGHFPPDEALAQIREIAVRRGGQLLTTRWTSARTPVRVACAEGHAWSVTPSDLRSGRWCGVCAGNVPLTFDALAAMARTRGGRLLPHREGERYRWVCAEGHAWDTAKATGVNAGTWCPECAVGSKLTRDDLVATVAKKGGTLVSTGFDGPKAMYTWRCRFGHLWEARGRGILNGSYCPFCARVAKGTIEQLHALAAKNGGECLAERYVNNVTPVRWRCAAGHVFERAPVSVKREHWCPFCQRKGVKDIGDFLLEDIQRKAAERGGACLSRHYETVHTELRFRCQVGHEWTSTASLFVMGIWCPSCAHTAKPRPENIAAVARERGGKSLGTPYENARTWLQLQCGKGHRFESRWPALRAGAWCQRCEKAPREEREPLDLGDLIAHARDLGGACLARDYGGANEPHAFRCRRGHVFETPPSRLAKGTWCPECTGMSPLTLEEMRATAEHRGGRCFATEVRTNRARLVFTCREGHAWSATGAAIRQGAWCPECLEGAPDEGIARVSAWARTRGGYCLSARYHNVAQRLRWRCAAGHTWRATEAVARMDWCPRCPLETGRR